MLPGNTRTKRKPSHEAIGLAAGLNRGQVQNILATGSKSASIRMRKKFEMHSTSERLLKLWRSEDRYVSTGGSPLDLPLELQIVGPSFTELVQKALPGKLPKHVLKDLRRRGLVEQLADEIIRYRPRASSALTSSVSTTALKYAAEQISLLGHTLLKSIAKGAFPERKDFRAYFSSAPIEMTPEQFQASQTTIQQRMSALTQAFEREFGKRDKKTAKAGPRETIGISVFTWRQNKR
jgi:hypothetical protein